MAVSRYWKCPIPKNINEWKKHPRRANPYTWSDKELKYFGYVTDDNDEICLAKVINPQLKRHQIITYLGLECTSETKRQIASDYYGKTMGIIQIGNVNEGFCFSGRPDENNPNVFMVEMSSLLRFPVPIHQDLSHYNTSDSDETIVNQRWIITNKIYLDGYYLCVEAMDCAKRGDWNQFSVTMAGNLDVVMCIVN